MTPCIDHGGKPGRDDYQVCWHQGRRIGKHVRALMERTGEQPNGRQALHSCDNKRCINGEHLRWGSFSDNVSDRKERQRYKKLTRDDVLAIRARLSEGLTLAAVGREFGVSYVMIRYIRDGKQWSDV